MLSSLCDVILVLVGVERVELVLLLSAELYFQTSTHPSTECEYFQQKDAEPFLVDGCNQKAKHCFGYLFMFRLTIIFWAPSERRKAVTAVQECSISLIEYKQKC